MKYNVTWLINNTPLQLAAGAYQRIEPIFYFHKCCKNRMDEVGYMRDKGVEKKIKRRRRFITISMIIICAGIMIGVALKSSYFSIKKIVVENNKFVSSEEIIALCQINQDNIFTFDSGKIKEKVLNNPYIEALTIRRKLPFTIVIDIKEKNIKGLFKLENSYINIDSEGRMVHIVNKFPNGKLPLIEGVKVEQYVQDERLIKDDEIKQRALLNVLTIPDYKECSGLFYSFNIEDPYKIILTTIDKTQINIGDYNNIDYKLGFALTLLNDSKIKGNKKYIEVYSDGTAVIK